MVVEVVGVVVDMCWHVNMVVCGDGSGVKLADLEEKNVNLIMCSLFTIHTMERHNTCKLVWTMTKHTATGNTSNSLFCAISL